MQPMARLQGSAPAKVNLTLRVLARREDGLHEIASLVAFAAIGDTLVLDTGAQPGLVVGGPMAAAAGPEAGNLVLKAARAAAARIEGLTLGRFELTKNLPAGAGLGGGSADAAAALRLLAQASDLAADDPRLAEAARATGADVPACLDPRARLMHGIGDELSTPVELPTLNMVLVFPGVAVSTGAVFRAHSLATARQAGRYAMSEIPSGRAALLEFLAREANDLEAPARSIAPIIGAARDLLQGTAPAVVRMTGSGSTVFAIYPDARAAEDAARQVRDEKQDWWVVATTLA